MAYQFSYDKINKIITIPLPKTEVTIQELLNDIRDFEDEVIGIDIYKIADASGKEELGGGVQVGITLKLIEWKLKFADRPGPNWVNCNVRGGNLVAVEIDSTTGEEIFVVPIEPSAYVTVSLTASSSATLQDLALTELKYRVESLRPHHTGVGDTYYWDPINGNDSNSGTDPSVPVKTFSYAQSLALDSNHDVIVCIPGTVGSTTITTEIINITKNYLFLRGPGRDFTFQPVTNNGLPTITINAEGVEVSSVHVKTSTDSTVPGISVLKDFVSLHNLWLDDLTQHGINIQNSKHSEIHSVYVDGARRSGINVGNNVYNLSIENSNIHNCNGSGVDLDGTNIKEVKVDLTSRIYSNKEYGIKIGKGAENTIISSDIILMNNVKGDLLDNGVKTDYSGNILRDRIADQVWDEPRDEHNPHPDSMAHAVFDILSIVSRSVGLMQENQYIDQNVYTTDANGNPLLTNARIRTYRDATSVGTDSHVLATYSITATWGGPNGNELQTYKVEKQ